MEVQYLGCLGYRVQPRSILGEVLAGVWACDYLSLNVEQWECLDQPISKCHREPPLTRQFRRKKQVTARSCLLWSLPEFLQRGFGTKRTQITVTLLIIIPHSPTTNQQQPTTNNHSLPCNRKYPLPRLKEGVADGKMGSTWDEHPLRITISNGTVISPLHSLHSPSLTATVRPCLFVPYHRSVSH
jgi:hypothetical protein